MRSSAARIRLPTSTWLVAPRASKSSNIASTSSRAAAYASTTLFFLAPAIVIGVGSPLSPRPAPPPLPTLPPFTPPPQPAAHLLTAHAHFPVPAAPLPKLSGTKCEPIRFAWTARMEPHPASFLKLKLTSSPSASLRPPFFRTPRHPRSATTRRPARRRRPATRGHPDLACRCEPFCNLTLSRGLTRLERAPFPRSPPRCRRSARPLDGYLIRRGRRVCFCDGKRAGRASGRPRGRCVRRDEPAGAARLPRHR